MENLQTAFRHHLQTQTAMAWGVKAGMMAKHCITLARQDVATGKRRYPAPLKPFPAYGAASDGVRCATDEAPSGLRYVGRVATECGGYRNGYFSKDSGWYTDPHGDVFKDDTGLCYGVVYQLAARNGHARFVAGYQFGGVDSGPTLDFKRIYVAERAESEWLRHDAADCPAVRKACYAADGMAKAAAEEERNYQTAWRAGSDYAQELETVTQTRASLRQLLSERRAAMNNPAITDSGYFALCDAIRAQVRSMLGDIYKARATMRKLAGGDAEELSFWTGEKRLQDAFCEGAGLDAFPIN